MGLRQLAKFSGAVALFAIFGDAAVGHGLLWENDPYWTYWVTKTFLIATVFALGTAWLGVGVMRGAIITAVHTVVLTIYYWTFSPIGLPSSPEWLDLEHTWVTGMPVHFGVIYLGYLIALWLWQRRGADSNDQGDLGATAGLALLASLAVVVIGGGLVSVALRDFPGFTWYLVRLLITVPFVLMWWAFAGRDRLASVVGGVSLAFIWATYSHFLGPVGLPDTPLRIFDQDAPGATVRWLDYRETWLISLPIVAIAAVVALVLVSRRSSNSTQRTVTPPLRMAGALVLVATVALGGVAFASNEPGGDDASVTASGPVQLEEGPWYGDEFTDGSASIELYARDRAARVTPLEPHDILTIEASVEHPDGSTYDVAVADPIVSDPLGRHTTWWGVGFHHWHHGRSGIGTDALPPIHSEIAVFGLGEISVDGEAIATGVPVHVMTAEHGLPGRLEMDVGDVASDVIGLPDGHLRVVWEDYEGGAGQGPKRSRNALGSAVLMGMLALGLLLNREETITA